MNFSNENIIKLSKNISNYLYEGNFEATKQLVELFDKISKKPLSTLEDYIKMYDDSFYTYLTWEELVKSEVEQGVYGMTEEECKEELGNSIWQLPFGWYVQCV
jgi:hypothetical protein